MTVTHPITSQPTLSMTPGKSYRSLPVAIVLILGIPLTGCPDRQETEPVQPVQDEPVHVDPSAFTAVEEVLAAFPEADAAALIHPVGDGAVRGYVIFQEAAGDLQVTANLAGLSPGRRGFHVHEHGSCDTGPEGDPAGAAGGHFAPLGRPHGGPHDPPEERHVGDLGNLVVDRDRTARVTFTDQLATLDGETGIVGRAVVVHAGEDDLVSQPAGDSGPRIGCGIITGRD
jgi:superoxide dismutase, Cu-Zn family